MTITGTMAPAQLAAFDQAVSAYRDACAAFGAMTGTGEQVRDAEAALRRAGSDGAGLITIPVAAVHFSDVRADGARMAAVNGSTLGGRTWIWWTGRMLRFGGEGAEYDAYDLIQVRA